MWIHSCLEGRTQYVKLGQHQFATTWSSDWQYLDNTTCAEQSRSSCMLQGNRMHIRYCVNCTGCQFITDLTTSWLWWLPRSAAIQHRHISVDTSSSCASLHFPYAHRMFYCLTNLLSEQNLLSILSDILLRLSGTRYLHKLSIVTLLLLSNLG